MQPHERHKPKRFRMSKTMALHMRYTYWSTSFCADALRTYASASLLSTFLQYAVQGGSNLSLWVKFYPMTTEV